MSERKRIIFIGPYPEVIELFGNKIIARQTAHQAGVPVIPGMSKPASLEEAIAFFETLPKGDAMMIKAMAGGGGKGMRVVKELAEVEDAYRRCVSESEKAFGGSEVYVEKYLPRIRHIEVQIIGDGKEVSHLWERECSIQRSNQKVIEIAPCPGISPHLRERIIGSAVQLAKAVNYKNLGTFEFLVEGIDLAENAAFYFIEVNPRIQVEHTITEEITGADLVKSQIQIALGRSLEDLNLTQENIPAPKGFAIQSRINTETIDSHGKARMKLGQISTFEMPYGRDIRIETCAYKGYQNSPNYDNLLAKLIVHTKTNDFEQAAKKMYRSLCECRIEGIETNLLFLQNIYNHSDFQNNKIYTRFIADHLAEITEAPKGGHQQFFFKKAKEEQSKQIQAIIPEGLSGIKSPMPGSVISIEAQEGTTIQKGQPLLILEAMKMESVIMSETNGVLQKVTIEKGQVVNEGDILFLIKEANKAKEATFEEKEIDLDYIRPELVELQERKAWQLDENRTEAVAKRKKKGKQTARENVAQLCDEGSFLEYGSLIVAAQRKRRSLEDLIKNTPADGIVTGIGSVNGDLFEEAATKCMVLCYDYTVLAGTQGFNGHHKTDRVLEVAHQSEIPILLFAEGGGGRPGETDFIGIAGLQVKTFALFARLNGLVPRIAIVSGYCFAGNAAMAGCADVIIATEDVSIGMGGPAMIDGGGLGQYHPKEVGPVSVQAQNGVLDIVVKDEAKAIETAKTYLSYFQGATTNWQCDDQRQLRHIIPENRRRVYDIRQVINTLADKDSVLELRKDFAQGMITAFIRIEGKPMGLIANNPKHLGGAIDADCSDKAARFMQLCNAFGIPMLSLCDTPGFMVGPDAEKNRIGQTYCPLVYHSRKNE